MSVSVVLADDVVMLASLSQEPGYTLGWFAAKSVKRLEMRISTWKSEVVGFSPNKVGCSLQVGGG